MGKLFSKILEGDRIAIPKEILKFLNLKKGDFVIFTYDNDSFEVTPAKIVERDDDVS